MGKTSSILENGYGIVPKAVIEDKNLSITSKVLYSLLCVFKGDGEVASPKRDTIMSYVGISAKNTYYKHREQLVDSGYIEVEECMVENRYASSNFKIKNEITVNDNKIKLFNGNYVQVPRKLMYDTSLSYTDKFVYIHLAVYKENTNVTCKILKKITGIGSDKRLFDSLQALERAGYLYRSGEKFTKTTYHLIGYDEFNDEELRYKLKQKIEYQDKLKQEKKNDTTIVVEEHIETAKTKKERIKIEKRKNVLNNQKSIKNNMVKAEHHLWKSLKMDKLKQDCEAIKLKEKNTRTVNDLYILEQFKFFEQSINLILHYMFKNKGRDVKVGKEVIDIDLLQETLLKLQYHQLLDVFNSISVSTQKIENPRAYTLVAIYNSITVPKVNSNYTHEDNG